MSVLWNSKQLKCSILPTNKEQNYFLQTPNKKIEQNHGKVAASSNIFFTLSALYILKLNWAILLCDVTPDGKTEYTAQIWQAIAQASELSFPVVFHTEKCAVHSGNPTVSSVCLPTPLWHNLKAHPFLAMHSSDEHRMIYSFSNTTPYSTFYAFLLFG